MGRSSAKVGKDIQSQKNADFALDTISEKHPRGRPRKIQPDWVTGTAEKYRYVFGLIWPHIWPGLSTAQTQQEVIQAVSRPEVGSYALDLIRIADLILQVVRDPKFPQRQREAQINFMADFNWRSWPGNATNLTRYLRKRTCKDQACSSHRSL